MKIVWTLILFVCISLTACGAETGPANHQPFPATSLQDGAPAAAPLSATAQITPATVPLATAQMTPTTAPVEPTLLPPPAIAPDSFSKAKVLHEYWPVIRKAAGLTEKVPFSTSATAWAYSPDGRFVAVGGCNAEAGPASVFSPYTAFCEQTIFETVAHAYLYILDAKTESIIATLPETGKVVTVSQLAFTPEGNKLVYQLDSGRIAIWDIPSAKIQAVVSEDSTDAPSFTMSPDGKWLALAGLSQTRIWDVARGKSVLEIPTGGASQFSTDGQRLLFEDYPYLLVYDTSAWQKVSERILMPDGNDNKFAFSPDLSLLATCDSRLTDKPRPMKIWDVATGVLLQKLNYKFSRCARLAFSPDGNLLLRFDDHGAGPAIWKLEGWKFINGSDLKTNFVGDKDLYVNSLQYSQDDQTVMVDTANRLTLYGLPQPAVASAPATPQTPSLPPTRPSAPTFEPKVQSCDIVVTGWLKLDVRPCLPPSRSYAGSISQGIQTIDLRDLEGTGVTIDIDPYWQTRLKPGTYPIADATEPDFKITAYFDYHDSQQNSIDSYGSYDNGTLTLTQSGLDQDYISGSFKFGAHNNDGRQINVEGSFENVPFSHVNGP